MAEGVWRTIKGRHVYIRNGEELASAMKRKKEWLENNRKELRNKVTEAQEGYKKKAELKGEENNWGIGEPGYGLVAYNTDKGKYVDKTGKYSGDINKAYIHHNDYQSRDAAYEYFEKHNIKPWELNRVRIKKDKSGSYIDFDKYLNEENQKAGNKINTLSGRQFVGNDGTTFNPKYIDAGIDKDTRTKLQSKLTTAYGGNSKTNYSRAQHLQWIGNDLDRYYKKHPVEVNESDFKRINKPMMQDALNDLYLTQVQSENADLKLKEWKARANANTPQGRRYRDIVESAKGGTAKEQINKINNTDFYETNGYMARFSYHPGVDSIYTDVYNLNARDDMSYPDVYDTYDRNSEDKKYGVNWSAMGTMSPADTKKYADRLRNAAEFADTLTVMEAGKKTNFKQMNTWQIEEMFIRQGYSEETARKMAKEYIAKRKRK